MTDTAGTESQNDKDTASLPSTLQGVGDKAREIGQHAAANVSDLVEEAKTRGASVAEEVTSQVTAAAEDRKGELADQLEDVAKAVHRSGEQLEGHQDWMAGLIERGADELASLATTLRSNDLKGLLGNLEDLARRQPALFLGASMAAGFAMVRLGKVAAAGMSSADLPEVPEVHFGQQ